MKNKIFAIKDIEALVNPIAEKYKVKEIYLFGSYGRKEIDENSIGEEVRCHIKF